MWTLAQNIRVIENFGGAGWTNQTNLHPLGLTLTVLCGLALLAMPRRLSIWPFIVMACMVAPAQRLVIGGLDFSLIRLMVIFGMLRVVLRHEYAGVRWQRVDYVILAFALVRTMAYTIQQASVSALIFQAGMTFDAVGLYFLFRCLVRDWRDVIRTMVGFIVMSLPVAAAFFVESKTGRNAFAFFGGVPEITLVREGRLRCQGAFAHPIIAGCFWASLIPSVVALWWQGAMNRLWALIGVSTMCAIVLFSASSTPVMGVIFGLLGWAMFLMRWWMRYVLILFVMALIGLHFSMNKPVWHLISRITIAKGNTGHHRYMLIDGAVNRFSEWALVGTRSTAHWFWGGQDVTNHYILEGVRGGFLTLALFVTTIWMCFTAAGRTWRVWSGDRSKLMLSWSLGVCLFVHCTNFIGVSYFGQAVFLWYLLLAMIVSMDEMSQKAVAARPRVRARRAPGGARNGFAPAGARGLVEGARLTEPG
ncbi:MAG: hypothetical protein SFZ24_00535 [Planctomycetota bacterium]|nr:hypothetical protein [Planctomycetota bacterium]